MTDIEEPCLVCGEPVISPSMSGNRICPACDLGRCRYCGMVFFVFKEKIDGGKSKKDILEHMEWHKIYTPEIVKRVNDGYRTINKIHEEKKRDSK